MPIQNLSPLSSCSRITALDLGYQRGIQDFALLSTLTTLRDLRLDACDYLRSLDPLRTLIHLTSLSISSTRVTSLEPLSSLSLLEELDLGSMRHLTSLDPLRHAGRLRKLDLWSCGSLRDLEPIGFCSQLLDLRLSCCFNLPRLALSPLTSCTALRQVDLRGCNLDLTPLASCSDLRRIYVCTGPENVNLALLEGLMPGLVVKEGGSREEHLDARSL